MSQGKPHVALVGAGPGDPELITLKALRLIREADVVLYDNLIGHEILEHARPGTHLEYVGKKCGHHQMTQEQINELLVESAQKFNRVVRLKGGDPFVFGRGGEEIQALINAGIPFEVVPGISSSIAAASYAGVPVTHRGLSCSFAVITGHESPEKSESQMRWNSFVGIDTLVFMMGVGNRQVIAARLIQAGRIKTDPVVFVENGTTKKQSVVRSTLDQVAVNPPEVETPAVMIIGAVAGLNLEWFNPLSSSKHHEEALQPSP